MNSTDFSDIPDIDRFHSLNTMSTEEVSEKFRKFMVAATAKDCSVMISLLPVENSSDSFKSLSIPNEGFYIFHIYIYKYIVIKIN